MLRRELVLGGLGVGVASAGPASAHPDPPPKQPERALASRRVIFREEDGEHLVRRAGPMGGLPLTIKLDDRVGRSSQLFVFTETLSPGQTIPWHRHDTCEEVMLIEEGGVTVTVGMERAEAGPRGMAFMPQGVWHSAINASNHPVHITSLYSGHDFSRYMRAISVAPGQPIEPIDASQLSKLRAMGHATYWDTRLGPFPPGVARP